MDGLQFTRHLFPLAFAGQHAVDVLFRVDVPLLAVGTNGNMGTSTRKPVPATILVLVEFLFRVNVYGTIVSPGVNLEGGNRSQRRYVSMQTKFFFKNTYLNAGAGHIVPIAGGSIPSENPLGSVAAPDGIINAGSSPDGGTRKLCPGVVVVVHSEDRLA